MTKKLLCLYVHTHWDREWYWAFERYRTQLGSVARRVIEGLADNQLPGFHLDGQSCVIEDIVETQPALAGEIERFVAAGRLSVGPWYVLADQMLVSGESLVRNMEQGLDAAGRFGKPMMVGYLPDTFGHTQDMPRILQGFGIDTALVWRGVRRLDSGPEFFWRSPDGSEVMCNLLPDGYYQSAFHETSRKAPEDRPALLKQYLLPWVQEESGLKDDPAEPSRARSFSESTCRALVPVGGDHLYPPTGFADLVEAVEGSLNGTLSVETVMLPDFLARARAEAIKQAGRLERIDGELRDNSASSIHKNAFLLDGVLSTRLYLKRANRIQEHRICAVTERLAAVLSLMGLTRYPSVDLNHAWKLLLKNQPHDSICGCSVDEVHREMSARSESFHQVLDVVERQVREELLNPGVHEWSWTEQDPQEPENWNQAGFGRWHISLADPRSRPGGFVVFNLSAGDVSCPVPFQYAIDPQELSQKCDGNPRPVKLDGQGKEKLLGLLEELVGDESNFQVDRITKETEVFGSVGGVPEYRDVCIAHGWLWANDVPALGYKALNGNLRKMETGPGTGGDASVVSSPGSLRNGFYRVEVDSRGDLIITAREASGNSSTYRLDLSFRDVADAGDSYNFDPVFDDRGVKSSFVRVEPVKDGSLCGTIRLIHELDIPVSIEESGSRGWLESVEDADDIPNFRRSERTVKQIVETDITLMRGVPVVFFDSTWNNLCDDHRMEVVFNTGSEIGRVWSENHFSLVERSGSTPSPVLPVARSHEAPPARFPCQRFLVANGQVFFNLGLPEFGIDGDEVTMTVLRAVSMLSRKRLLTRGGGAGPHMPVPEANCRGHNHVTYGWAPLSVCTADSDPDEGVSRLSGAGRASAYKLAELFEGPVWMSPVTDLLIGEGGKLAGPARGILSLNDDRIRITALYSRDDGKSMLVRLLNVDESPVETRMAVASERVQAVELVNLAGNTVERLDLDKSSAVELIFGANELLTCRLLLD